MSPDAGLPSILERLYRDLERLTLLDGVAGSEQAVVAALVDAFAPLADQVTVDLFGNLSAVRQGPPGRRTLMLVAHSDEVGCVVHSILPDGMLRLEPMGFVSLRALPGSPVRVGAAGLPGVVGVPPAHLDGGADRLLPFHALHVDIGADSEAEVRQLGIAEGDPVAFAGLLQRLHGNKVTGKAIDNRIGCAVLLELLRALHGKALPVTLVVAVAVQEEIGMRGARMLAERWRPNLAIAVDTVPADDAGVATGGAPLLRLGRGPVVQMVEGVMSAYTGTVHHPAVRRLILSAAVAEGVAVQRSVSGRWTTDAAAVHTAAGGIPTGFISIPRRYAHSPVEVLDLADAVGAVAVLAGVVKGADEIDLSFLPEP